MRDAVVVIGYASSDRAIGLETFSGIDATSIVTRPPTEPTAGGVAHLARAVTAAGARTEVLSWVGADEVGAHWIDSVREAECGITGVHASGTRSPSAVMIDIASGGTICLFDPGECRSDRLTEPQLALLRESSWVLLTVAPRHLLDEVLDHLAGDVRLAWAVKQDEDALPSDLRRRLTERADLISYSRGERAFLTNGGSSPLVPRVGAVLIETRGADGGVWSTRDADGLTHTGTYTAEHIQGVDTTGAGDTFVGTVVGAIARSTGRSTHSTRPELDAAVHEGASAATALLRRRAQQHHEKETT